MQCAHCAQQVTRGIVDDTQKSRSTRHMARTVRTLPSGCPLCVACCTFSQFPYSIAIRHIRCRCAFCILSFLILFYFLALGFISFALRTQLHTEWCVHFRLGTLSSHHTFISFDDKIWLLFLLGFIIHRKHHQRHSKNPIKLICRCVDGRSIKTCIQIFFGFCGAQRNEAERKNTQREKMKWSVRITRNTENTVIVTAVWYMEASKRFGGIELVFGILFVYLGVCLLCASIRWWARRAQETRFDDYEPDCQRRWHKNVPAMSFDRSFFLTNVNVARLVCAPHFPSLLTTSSLDVMYDCVRNCSVLAHIRSIDLQQLKKKNGKIEIPFRVCVTHT